MIILFAHLLLGQAFAQTTDETCSKSTPIVCAQLASKAQSERNFEKAYRFSKLGCDNDLESSCSQIYPNAEQVGKEKVEEAKAYLIKKCADHDRLCGDLATVYYDEKNTAKALEIDRKYFSKYHLGAFPLKTFQAGNQKEGYEASLQVCELDADRCAFYIRYMPDNPKINRMLTIAEKQCRSSDGQRSGATSCAILGSYFYANQNHAKAIELWNVECSQKVNSACELILGSDALSAMKVSAFKNFCGPSLGIEVSASALQKTFCPPKGDVLPDEVMKAAREFLQAYLREQTVESKSGRES